MKRLFAAFVFAVAASATLPALADAYTFTAGTAIPLKDNDAQASWVTTNKQVGEYNLEGDRYGAATLTLTLNNATAGNYVLVFQGVNNAMETTLTLSATDNNGYSRAATITQPKSSSWSDYTEHMFLLDDLPAGDFTLNFSAKPITGTSWNGGYKDFTFYKLDESPYSLTGTPYDIASNSGTALSLAEGQTNGRLKLSGNQINIDSSDIIGSTHSGDTMLFWLNCSSAAKFSFKYSASNNSGGTPTVNWSLIGNGGNLSFSDTIASTGNWNTFNEYEHDLGTLAGGKYLLKATLSSSQNWAGNYKDFTFTTGGTKNITAADGLTLDADADWTYAIVTIENGAIIDLNGHNLTIGSGIDTLAGTAVFTNSVDETLSTLTIANPDNGNLYFGGNLRYVATGAATNFRMYNSGNNLQNTHTGGTVLSNLTAQINFYCPANFGTGNLVFAGNASAFMPSNERQDFTSSSGVEVYGTGNFMSAEGKGGANSWDSATIKFNGELSGDGELTVSNGWQPQIHFDGASTNFTGKLIVTYDYNHDYDYSWWRGVFFERAFTVTDGSASLENAAVLMTNRVDDARNRLYIAGNTSSLVTFPIGALTTDGSDAAAYTNTVLYTYKDGVNLEVGARGEDGTFAGNVIQNENKYYQTSLVKVGAGTWTLTGTNHVYGGTTTVKGGRLNIDSSEFTAGTAIIVTNAVLGGTGTIKVPITVKEDGVLAGSFTATSTVTFEAGAFVEVAADATATPTFSGAIDASTLTVKLTGELDTTQEYTILTAGSGSSGKATVVVDTTPTKGRWRTKWVAGDGGTKILKCHFAKPGFVLIIQ